MRALFGFFLMWVMLCVGAKDVVAQEKYSPLDGVYFDIWFGQPWYFGDFNPLSGSPEPLLSREVSNGKQSSATSFGAAILVPIRSSLAGKFRFSSSTLSFSDESARIRFENTHLDISVDAVYYPVRGRFSAYVQGGVGLSAVRDISLAVQNTEDSAEWTINVGTNVGLGIDYAIVPKIRIFAEGELYFLGTDRFDGYNGGLTNELQRLEQEDAPKSYFQRDKLILARAGIRVRLPSLVKQKNSDADLPRKKQEDKKDEQRQGSIYDQEQDLGVRYKLEDITLKADFVVKITDLGRHKDVAQRIAKELSTEERGLEVLLLKEKNGYSVHFGTFKRYEDAKGFVISLRQYYSNLIVVDHK